MNDEYIRILNKYELLKPEGKIQIEEELEIN